MAPSRGVDRALFTDLYELTMAASYHAHGLNAPATFELFVRELPPRRGYLLTAGAETVASYLEELRFNDHAIAYLDSLKLFDHSFLDSLAGLHFTGEVWAIPEGEVVFATEPIVRVTAPLIEAQIVETFLLNAIGYETMVATKASRIATACAGRRFVDFSARRDHGTDAALAAARASYIGGAAATSLVLAGDMHGLDLSGTMAHSYVMSFDDESDAFRTFAFDFPGRAVLLIDTYDTEAGAKKVVAMADELRTAGALPRAVRLDSGDLDRLSRAVRQVLDDGGLNEVGIFASGDLDEYQIGRLMAAGAPIDAFGVGTQLGTGGDASHLGVVYKLVEDSAGPKMKLSTDKQTVPGRKQVYRVEADGCLDHDVLALHDESGVEGRPLLRPVMTAGRRVAPPEPVTGARARAERAVAALPSRFGELDFAGPGFDVRHSPLLAALAAETGVRSH
jgi:nicotinate phosphoribosyltransferase